MRNRRLALVIGLLGALLVAPMSASAAPVVTTISIVIVFEQSEEFTTTGGVLCPSGDAVTDPIFFAGFGRMGRGAGTFHLTKTLICDDGSGTFQILVNVGPGWPGTIGGFSVSGGTGAYADLQGGGSLIGTPTDVGINDLYTGRLTN